MEYRIEKDTLGEVKVPADKLWGAQTERSRNNFKIGPEASMPIEIIHSYAIIKKAAAKTNHSLGVLSKDKMELISTVCDEIIDGKHNDQFPLVVWQTGSGTQTNMNVNEVISNRSQQLLKKDLNDEKCIISVRHNWFNSNPVKSLYWAVQGMASELATGLAIIDFANKNNLTVRFHGPISPQASKWAKNDNRTKEELILNMEEYFTELCLSCLLYTSPSPRD